MALCVDAMFLKGEQNPIGFFIIAYRTDGKTFQAKLGGINDGAAGGACDGEADFFDELHVAAVRDAGDGPSQYIKDVKADDRNVVTHVSGRPCSCR